MTKRAATIYLTLIGLIFLLVIGWYTFSFTTDEEEPTPTATPLSFQGASALADVETQLAFGPRTPSSEAHAQIRAWIRTELESAGWVVSIQEAERLGHPIFNIVARRNDDNPQIILGAHYDTRFFADQDPDPNKRIDPVPGANDGASGVAILLEMARTLPMDTVPTWLVFFDTEDQGNIANWDWILGSRAFAEALSTRPEAVVVVDMIGDADLNIYLERNSDLKIRTEIWDMAARLGHGDVFINEERYSMEDDHTPFLEAGLPAVDIIDFDYPYWHTTSDTTDKVSAESLQAVGETLWNWIVERSAGSVK